MWWLIALLGGFGVFEFLKHEKASSTGNQVASITPGKAYTLVVTVSGVIGVVDPVSLLQLITNPSSWSATGLGGISPFSSAGSIPSPAADGSFLVPVVYNHPEAPNFNGNFPAILPMEPVTLAASAGSIGTVFPSGSVRIVGALAT